MKITMLYGGQSAEHDISILSAHNIVQQIMFDVYTVQPIYITRQGKWIKGPLLEEPSAFSEQLRLSSAQVESWCDNEKGSSTGININPGDIAEEDTVVFPILHGPNGEDGTIQGFLEILNLPYVGAGVAASAAGMDKIISKNLFERAGLPQVPYIAFDQREWQSDKEDLIARSEGSLLYPLFVKPANLGSSVGISRVTDSSELVEAVELALQFDRRIVVEQGIRAEECEVAVLGNDDAHVSVVGQLVKQSDFYNYDEKYINNAVEMQIPAEIPNHIASQVQEYALAAYRAIDCSGLARVDFFLTNNGDIYINEINTMPGFTQYSMYPNLWLGTGLSQRDLIDELIQLALRRHERNSQLKVDF